MLCLNCSSNFEIIIINIKEGKTTDVVATTAPASPDVTYPANVATLTPIGPGVIEDIAIISANCFVVYHFWTSAIWYKNGNVAYPPPNEKSPI